MFPSIFTDELGLDITEALPIIKSWGLDYVDLRGRVLGKAAENLEGEELCELRKLLDAHGMRVGCLQTSLAKVHLPDADRQQAEMAKLERIIGLAEATDCRLVRSFHYWQPPPELRGALAVRPDEQQKVLDMFRPLAERARAAGLLLTFENCGVTPDEVLTVVDALGVPAWGLAWDVNNGWDCDERRRDEDAFMVRLAKRARLVHVKARGALAELGGDLIPYDRVLQLCDNAGVEGPVSAETHNPDKSVDNVERSRRVVELIKRSWPTAAPGGLDVQPVVEGVTRPWADAPVRFVVVGLGMGHNRSKVVCKNVGTELVGVCDIREERAVRTSEECGVPYHTDVDHWLQRDDVDVVYVLTETGRHGEIAVRALNAGKHAITTKPMEASLSACDEMIRTAEERGLLLGVDFDRRFRKDLNSLRASVQSGAFGRLLNGSFSLNILRNMDYFRANGGWRGTRRWDGGGVLSNQSIHHIDEIAFAIGVPARVRCSIWTQNHDIEAEDLGVATWLYENGFVLSLTATSSYPHKTWYNRLEFCGTDGAYSAMASGPFDAARHRYFIDGAWSDTPPVTAESEWLNASDNFAAALRAGAPLVCSGRDGRRTQSVLDAMYRSAYEADGDWVDVAGELV